jgi:uncharacterized membrane protein YeaQ/YmgE (transglycosylase-associated protein family)
MEPLEIVILVVVAGACGALGKAIVGTSEGGLLVAVALGFIGALIGMWLSRKLDLPEVVPLQIGSTRFPIVWSIAGSAIFVGIISILSRSSRKEK